MKPAKKESLLDFYREQGKRFELMNAFLSRFREGDVIYVCGSLKGNIPGYRTVRYEIRKMTPARYRIRRHLFREPEFIILQKPELFARCLGGMSQSMSSVNNYLKMEIGAGDSGYDQIFFIAGSAHVFRGELIVRHSMVLEVFGSHLAYMADSDRIERYETAEKFEERCVTNADSPHRCIARVSPEPVLCFPF